MECRSPSGDRRKRAGVSDQSGQAITDVASPRARRRAHVATRVQIAGSMTSAIDVSGPRPASRSAARNRYSFTPRTDDHLEDAVPERDARGRSQSADEPGARARAAAGLTVPPYRSTIAVMSSLCAAPWANCRTSANSASSSCCGCGRQFCSTHVDDPRFAVLVAVGRHRFGDAVAEDDQPVARLERRRSPRRTSHPRTGRRSDRRTPAGGRQLVPTLR